MTYEQETRRLLATRPRSITYAIISESTDLSIKWLKSFAGDSQEDYGIRRVEKLRAFLKGQERVVVD